MANLKSSIKRVRRAHRRAAINQVTRSTARTYIKQARKLIAEGSTDEAQVVVKKAVSALDKAAEKGVIHRNNAARRKSRLMKMLNKASA